MAKICTSIDQSKKLTKLGIDTNTADMYYIYDGFEKINSELPSVGHKCLEKDIPAWSLSALLELMPEFDNQLPSLRKCRGYYCVVYSDSTTRIGDVQWQNGNNPLDAVFEMICWLKENKKI